MLGFLHFLPQRAFFRSMVAFFLGGERAYDQLINRQPLELAWTGGSKFRPGSGQLGGVPTLPEPPRRPSDWAAATGYVPIRYGLALGMTPTTPSVDFRVGL